MEIGKIQGLSASNVNFKGEISEAKKPDYRPEGRLLAEKEMTNLVHVDNYISSLRGLSNNGFLNEPKFDFYITEDYSRTLADRYGHKQPAISTLEAVNQKTKQPRLLARYIGEKLVLKVEYDDKTGKAIKKTEFYGNSGNGRVYYFNEDGKCTREESLK